MKNKAQIEISVVVPVFNGMKTIGDALDSVMAQTAIHYVKEIIVVNDGSQDTTSKLVEEWKEKNLDKGIDIILINQENQGVADARNNGVSNSCGNYIAFLDADDIWLKNKLEKQCQVLEAYPRICTLGTGWKGNNKCPGKKIKNNCGLDIFSMGVKDELFKYWPSICSVIIKRSAFMKVGGFSKHKKHAEDAELFCKLAEQQKVYYISEELIDCGHGKNPFGERGLSMDLAAMHKGFQQNVIGCFQRGSINGMELFLFLFWEEIKYFRRLLIVVCERVRKKSR